MRRNEEEENGEELGGGEVHSKKSGVTDHLAEDDKHALQIARNIVSTFNKKKHSGIDFKRPEEPKYDLKSIQLGYKTVRIITSHPSNSYKWFNKNEVIDSLVILNQKDFWNNSKFLVLEVK